MEIHEDVQYKVLQRAELANSIWNLRFNLNKVTKRIHKKAKVFRENRINKLQFPIEQACYRYFQHDHLGEEHVPLIQGFKCLDSPPPVPPSSSQGEDEESTTDLQN